MQDVQKRLVALSEKYNKKTFSESTAPTPLSTFLLLYIKARHTCYIDYMKGAKALHDWLTSNRKIPLEWDICWDGDRRVPTSLDSYELQQLAKIVVGTDNLTDIAVTKYAIFRTLLELANE